MALRDSYNRSIRDLRISVTDRCNLRCFYCLPNGEPAIARKDTLLTFEELEFVADIFVSLGIEKIRLTGGEPLVRRGLTDLVAKLSRLKPALKDLALTTNGLELPRYAEDLKAAGLDRVTISLDSLDQANLRSITGVDILQKVLASIDAAKANGFEPIKINAVIVRGRNDHEIVDLARFAHHYGVAMRFIEYMPLDSGDGWNRQLVVSGKQIIEAIQAELPLKLISSSRGSETAWRYGFEGGGNGEIGVITPVTDSFCGQCSRIRLTADGQIRTCLFSTTEHDLRGVIRSGASRGEAIEFIESAVMSKEPRHLINEPAFKPASRSMSFIGG